MMASAVVTELKVKLSNMKMQVDVLKKEIEAKEKTFQDEYNKHTKAEAELEEASKVADESDRSQRTLETRQNLEDDRIVWLTNLVRNTTVAATEAKNKYEEAARKLTITKVKLERAKSRLEAAESRMRELQSIVQDTRGRLKSLEHLELQATKQRKQYESRLAELTTKLTEAESRATEASQLEAVRQSDLCKLEEALEAEQLNHTNLRKEMENMLNEVDNI
ncbi:Tropomyosin-2 [Fasciola hepatica]|uniref:Tropomyosin-2 n=1 Tax=Fasciola hepatica TaxID=6192 RepID=A0A4E0RML7_FASHE|nr:Tropomyosin-2 [Fasciola hepatica]